jgi:hypothetical protein
MSTELKALFHSAGISLEASDASLFSSEDSVSRSISSIKSLEDSLKGAEKKAHRDKISTGIIRLVALGTSLGLFSALVSPSIKVDPFVGAGVGVVVGAAGGGIWIVVDSLPAWLKPSKEK